MEAFIGKIMAFIVSLMCFLGSFGLGSNPPVTINVTDSENNPVSSVEVYYSEGGSPLETMNYYKIGVTDEEGNVKWENQKYGEQTILINTLSSDSVLDYEAYQVEISRTSNDTVCIVIE